MVWCGREIAHVGGASAGLEVGDSRCSRRFQIASHSCPDRLQDGHRAQQAATIATDGIRDCAAALGSHQTDVDHGQRPVPELEVERRLRDIEHRIARGFWRRGNR